MTNACAQRRTASKPRHSLRHIVSLASEMSTDYPEPLAVFEQTPNNKGVPTE